MNSGARAEAAARRPVTAPTPRTDPAPLNPPVEVTVKRFRVALALGAIYLIWGTTYLAVVIMLRTIPPFAGSAMRYSLGGTLLLAWLLAFRRQAFAGLPWPRLLLAGVLLVAGGNGFAVWAQQGVPSGIAALLISSVPVFVMVLNWLFFARRAPDTRSLAGILIGMCGVGVIVVHLHSLAGAVRMPYVFALLGAMLCWSSGTLVSRGTVVASQVSAATCVQMLVGAGLLSLIALVHGDWHALHAARVAPASWLALGYLTVFGSIVALSCFLWLLTQVPPHHATTYALVNPVIALLLGSLLLGERITADVALAVLLILVGVGLVLFQGEHALAARLRRWWPLGKPRT
jgi:drug/metabolite transporter (DMT)-like permease